VANWGLLTSHEKQEEKKNEKKRTGKRGGSLLTIDAGGRKVQSAIGGPEWSKKKS